MDRAETPDEIIARLRRVIEGQGLSMAAMRQETADAREEIERLALALDAARREALEAAIAAIREHWMGERTRDGLDLADVEESIRSVMCS